VGANAKPTSRKPWLPSSPSDRKSEEDRSLPCILRHSSCSPFRIMAVFELPFTPYHGFPVDPFSLIHLFRLCDHFSTKADRW